MNQDDKIWHPYTRFSALSEALPVIEASDGLYLIDQDGKRYLDCISSWWCMNLGHGHPRIVDAIQQQAGKLQHSILGNMSHPGALELSRRLAALMPSDDRHVLFASDGASANEAALRVAVQYFDNLGQSGRNRFISLTDPYHGDTFGAVSVGYMEEFHRALKPLIFDGFQVPAPVLNRSYANCLAALDQVIAQHGSQIAGMIVEPLCQGTAGMALYSEQYLREACERCRAAGILFIVDEIAMGYGRTGKMFAFEHAGIDPDIVTVGKGITAGYLPLSAAIVRDSIYDTFSDQETDHTFYHGHTFAGNPIACAAALKTLDLYREEKIVEQAARKGKFLQEQLKRFSDFSTIRDIRGLGMVAAIDCADVSLARRIQQRMKAAGYLLRPLGDTIYLMLPLVTPEETIIEVIDALVVCFESESA